ncbi:cell envelope integrity protein TolA [Luteimonas sp. TWI662]|uniref:cell envelope integrity protein TolA n=1 Tax=unclassified Luteimonas TaxID=2629088 RepID=UPI00320A2449
MPSPVSTARAAFAVSVLAVCGLTTPVAGRADDGLEARYRMALHQAVQSQWRKPDIVGDVRCRVLVRQLPGGDVVSVEPVRECGFDAKARQSLLEAVYRASPLPYSGFERVFERQLVITFTSGAP